MSARPTAEELEEICDLVGVDPDRFTDFDDLMFDRIDFLRFHVDELRKVCGPFLKGKSCDYLYKVNELLNDVDY